MTPSVLELKKVFYCRSCLCSVPSSSCGVRVRYSLCYDTCIVTRLEGEGSECTSRMLHKMTRPLYVNIFSHNMCVINIITLRICNNSMVLQYIMFTSIN